jgi:hypothetical protein
MSILSFWKKRTATWLDELGREYGKYRRPPNAYGMTTDNELQFLETYARDQFTGKGRIVDLGCWYGATTLSLARGLAQNRRVRPNRFIEAFDLFEWHEWMDPIAEQVALPRRYASGEIFFDDVKQLLLPYVHLVMLARQDLITYHPPSAPVEFLFIDAMKTWDLAQSIVRGFFPLLIPGTSYVVQQDFAYYYPQMATNHLIMWYLRDCFRWVHHVPRSCSVVFRCVRRPDVAGLPPLTPALFSAESIDEAYEYSLSCVSEDMRVMVEFAKLNFLIEQGLEGSIHQQLKRVSSLAAQVTPPMLAEMESVAAAAAASRRLTSDLHSEIASVARRLAGAH